MEIELILSEIDSVQKKLYTALEEINLENYIVYFDDTLKYAHIDASIVNKQLFVSDTKKSFNQSKSIFTEYYRIKSSFNDGIFTEKIARKSKISTKMLLLFAKKQTIQTEEIYQWKKFEDGWKVVSVEITLEEKY